MPTPDDPRVDPHLRAALRHAPDHDAAPPAALSEAIRAAAHAAIPAVPVASKEPPAPWWRRWWQASGNPHGPWGAALASLAVVAVTLGLWHGQETPAPVAPREAALPPTPAAATAAAPLPTQPPAPTVADAPVVAAAPAALTDAARPVPAAPKATVKRQRAAPTLDQQAPTAVAALPAAAPAPRPEPPPEAAAAASPPVAADALARASPQADRQAAAERAATGLAAARADSAFAAAKAAPATPLRGLQQRLLNPDSAFQWRDGDAAAEAAGPPAQAWLQRLGSAAAGRWLAAAGPTSEPVSRHLRWLQDGRTIAEAQVLASGVRFIDTASGSTWYVALPAPELDALRQR